MSVLHRLAILGQKLLNILSIGVYQILPWTTYSKYLEVKVCSWSCDIDEIKSTKFLKLTKIF